MPESGATSPWREAGHAIAANLDDHGAAVIIAPEPEHAAEVALGIAEVQARRRRVAVGDLIGEVGPLQSLVPDDIAHGLMDSFVHGVSLNRIAHPVDRAGNLFILQSGAGPIDYPVLLRDDRWRRLASGFCETGALLLAVVPEGAPGVDALAHSLGGIVRVDGARVPGAAPIIATVGEPGAEAPEPESEPAPAPELPVRARVTSRRTTPDAVDVLRSRTGGHVRVRERETAGIGLWIAIIGGIVIGAGAVVGWMYRDRLGLTNAAQIPIAAASSGTTDHGTVANVSDSASAASYVVVIANVNDTLAARQRIATSLQSLPAPTFSADAPWFRVSVGAFDSDTAADAMLQALRARRVLEPESGYLLRAPFSLRLSTVGDSSAARIAITAWQSRGLPAFALSQRDSSIVVYAGAYETAEQAAAALAIHRPIAPTAEVAYRVGRPY